jgi:hypothetical protein
MWFGSWFDRWSARSTRRRATGGQVKSRQLALESLDDRIVLATLSATDATISEGNAGVQSALVSVNLSAPVTKTVTVNYATAAGTAQGGSDFQSVAGKLTFAPGETRKTIAVPVYGDRLGEQNETFSVNLSGAKGARIGDGRSVVTIVDDEPRINIEGVAWDEHSAFDRMYPFAVRLSAPSTEVVTVNFTTADGAFNPANGISDPSSFATAAAGDYVATSGTLTFAPGETTKIIYVQVFDDDISENDEYFFVNLSGATGGYFIDQALALGWIIDDDSDRGWIDYSINP